MARPWQQPALVVSMAILGASLTLFGCTSESDSPQGQLPRRRPVVTTTSSTPVPTTTSSTPPPATVVAAFVATVVPVSEADLKHTYRAECPVAPDQLRALHVTYWAFDRLPHTGEIVVAADVVDEVTSVFHRLFDAQFPIHSMVPVAVYDGSDPDSMAADNTSGFNCRLAVASGPSQWSAHSFGRAIDVNPIENPYVFEGAAQPDAGTPFLDRSNVRPGMAVEGGTLVEAFAAVGWEWGGRWDGAPDYQHFSASGS